MSTLGVSKPVRGTLMLISSFQKIFLLIFCTSLTLSCSENVETPQDLNLNQKKQTEIIALNVYKDPNCGCCSKWISHMEDNHFLVNAINTNDIEDIKLQHNIQAKYQSCHTAISQDGYVFEGHVPAKYVQQFLAEKPTGAIGLSVPSMPVGSPGMEVGSKFLPYKIFMLMEQGEAQVYAEIAKAEQQF